MACAICTTRRPRRYCPGVRGEICAICCGEGREETITCPLDCEYLQEAHKHEKPVPLDPEKLPNRDVRPTEELIETHANLISALASGIAHWAVKTEAATDWDVRDAFDALTRTYRTLITGIYYETRPENRLAADLFDGAKEIIEGYRKVEAEQSGIHQLRDSEVLALLVFLQHFELDRNNGRKRSRAFLESVYSFHSELTGEERTGPPSSTLLLP